MELTRNQAYALWGVGAVFVILGIIRQSSLMVSIGFFVWCGLVILVNLMIRSLHRSITADLDEMTRGLEELQRELEAELEKSPPTKIKVKKG